MFGFNSAGYDVKLIKKFLFKELCNHGEQPSFTVKKAGKYPCIKTEHLKFMDILQFLAPGYNLKSFFKAFGVSEQKGFFPYDYFTHADQLDETILPPMKLSTLSLKVVMSWKKNMLHSKSFSTKENPNKKPYNPLDYQQNQKPALKIISGFNSYGLKITGQLLQILSNGITI